MAITRAKTIQNRKGEPIHDRQPIAPSVTLFNGGFAALNDFAHATATLRGRLSVWSAAAGQLPMAPNEGPGSAGGTQSQDDSSATGDANGTIDVGLKLGPYILKARTVTGLVDEEDVLRYVYLSDDDVDTNLTLTNNGNPVGIIWRYVSGTTGDVLMFGPALGFAMARAGYGFEDVQIGQLAVSGLGAGETGLEFETQRRCLVVGHEARPIQAALGGGGAVVFEVRKNGVACHGAGEQLSLAAALGVGVKTEANITEAAIATCARGDDISVAIVSNGGVTGSIKYVVRLFYLGG